jgi:hypothetical protein
VVTGKGVGTVNAVRFDLRTKVEVLNTDVSISLVMLQLGRMIILYSNCSQPLDK